jgi:NAD(P)-dependent dehydrogenase (short-subunit alcohol dehydrogenase family)
MNTQTQKIALITGGSRGLGRNTAESLARKGVDAVIMYHSRADEARAVTAAIEAEGRKAVALQFDTGAVGTFDHFAERFKLALRDTWDRDLFDFLINNAGISHHNSIEKTTEAELDALYNVHFKGVFFLTQKLLPLINDGARIVNFSSGLTRIIFPGSGPYGSMKGAIEVADQVYGQGIRAVSDRCQCRRSGRYRNRLQRRHGAGQSRREQACRRHDNAWSGRRAGRHRADDRGTTVRGQPLG